VGHGEGEGEDEDEEEEDDDEDNDAAVERAREAVDAAVDAGYNEDIMALKQKARDALKMALKNKDAKPRHHFTSEDLRDVKEKARVALYEALGSADDAGQSAHAVDGAQFAAAAGGAQPLQEWAPSGEDIDLNASKERARRALDAVLLVESGEWGRGGLLD